MSSKVASLGYGSLGRTATDRPVSARPVTPVPLVGDRDQLHPSLIAELVKAGPPVDAEKVRRIRDAIAGGSYQIDAKAIAEAMIAGL